MFDITFNIFSLARRIGRPLILNGAMGSMLQQEYNSDDTLWMSYLNEENPGAVINLHRQYIKAGADIISTNTFRTNPAAVKQSKYDFEQLCTRAIENAFIAAGEESIIIAGSNPPAEDSYQKDRYLSYNELSFNHANHIKVLYSNNCYFILNETQSHLDEIMFICSFCYENKIPYVISLFFTDNLKILSGEKLDTVIPQIRAYAPLAIGFNCIKPETFIKFYDKTVFDYNWGVYFNCGSGNFIDTDIQCGVNPSEFIYFVDYITSKQPSFIGACCGSNPAHIKELKKYLDGRKNIHSAG